jgi:hypothetical protein
LKCSFSLRATGGFKYANLHRLGVAGSRFIFPVSGQGQNLSISFVENIIIEDFAGDVDSYYGLEAGVYAILGY